MLIAQENLQMNEIKLKNKEHKPIPLSIAIVNPGQIILRQKSPGTSSIMYIHMTRTLNLSHFLSLAMQLRASEIRERAASTRGARSRSNLNNLIN